MIKVASMSMTIVMRFLNGHIGKANSTLQSGGVITRLQDIVALAKTRLTRSLTSEECKTYLHMEQCPSKP
jgi:hypothetical protein